MIATKAIEKYRNVEPKRMSTPEQTFDESLATKKPCPRCGQEAKHIPAHGIYAAQYFCPKCGTVPDRSQPATSRLVIGECERAGHPISAPVESERAGPVTPGALRWVHKKSGTFVLEQFGRKGCCHIGWHEVPVIEEA